MRKNNKGFTLIEVMIVVIMISACIALIAKGYLGMMNQNVTWGVNGTAEMRCINNYQFIISEGGQARQVLDEFGKGARCRD